VLHYEAKPDYENEALTARPVKLAHERRRFGYRRQHALVEREGIPANRKRVHRLYREAGPAVRRRRRRHGVMLEREQLALPSGPNEVWPIDFVMDALSNGRRLKCLTIVDDFTKEAIHIVVDHGISRLYVATALDGAARFRGYPKALRTDQGPEFTSRALDQWAYANGVTLKLVQPNKPTQNAYIESFNGKFRDECLNCTGSQVSRMLARSSRRGAWTTTRNGCTAQRIIFHQQSSRRNIGQQWMLLPRSMSWFRRTLLEAGWPYRRGLATPRSCPSNRTREAAKIPSLRPAYKENTNGGAHKEYLGVATLAAPAFRHCFRAGLFRVKH